MTRNLEGMVVVITGASAGIGKVLAEQLAEQGAKLVLAARRVERLEAMNRKMADQHLVLRADVSRRDECEMLVQRAVEHFGRIDTLVCNAGWGIYKTIAETAPPDMRRIFATNFFGTTDCIHAAVGVMLQQEPRDGVRGQIMIVSSSVARRAVPYMGAYSATKAAQLSIAEALRVELRPWRIAVTSVHPITTKTEFGTVAEEHGGVKIARAPVGQSVDVVVRKMVRAIARPRPELWPFGPSRWAIGLAALFPRLADAALHRYRRQVEQKNSPRAQTNG